MSPLLLGALGLSVKGANILTIPVWSSWHAAKLIGDHPKFSNFWCPNYKKKYFQREGLDCWHFSPFWFVHLNNCQENKGPWKCSLYKASNHYIVVVHVSIYIQAKTSWKQFSVWPILPSKKDSSPTKGRIICDWICSIETPKVFWH